MTQRHLPWLCATCLALSWLLGCAPSPELAPLTVYPAAAGFIPWTELRNPVYSHPDWSVKDACMVHREGVFYLFFSAFFFDGGRERSHVVGVKTRDFRTFSDPLFILSGVGDGWLGMASPDVAEIEGTYYLTYNSWGDKAGRPNQLFYGESRGLEHWTLDLPLARNLTRGKRAIDAAITYRDGRYYLAWKERQRPQMAWAKSLDGDWQRLGRPSGGWFENAHFVDVDGRVHLLVTGFGLRPYLMYLAGDGDAGVASLPTSWLQWSQPRRLEVPEEAFNTDHPANAAFLADWRRYDGHFYLLYAGRTEGRSHLRRGDNRLGLARSRDLVNWTVPPGW